MSQLSMRPVLDGRPDVVLTNQHRADVGSGLKGFLLVGDGRPQRIRIDRATVHVADQNVADQNLIRRGPRQLIEELERIDRGGGDDGQRSNCATESRLTLLAAGPLCDPMAARPWRLYPKG